jgi:pimeloyl-[acyl-carrier protein] methyl ester esterase
MPQVRPRPQPAARGQILAMHGWSGDAAGWEAWRLASGGRGWHWQAGERGYGGAPPVLPRWREGDGPGDGPRPRTLLVHSLGLHLLPPDVLAATDQLVLLASFSRFVPAGRDGRRARQALDGMTASLRQGRGGAMLRSFLAEAAAPQDPRDLPEGPAHRPLTAAGRQRLLADLDRLRHTAGLPEGLPAGLRVLVVEASEDRILPPPTRRTLLRDLVASGHRVAHWRREGIGHTLLDPELVPAVLGWMEELRSP